MSTLHDEIGPAAPGGPAADGARAGTAPEGPQAAAYTGRGRLVLRRFRRNRPGLAGLAVILLMFFAAFAGPRLTQWTYTAVDFSNFQTPPSALHWFGTTQDGQDLFALTMRGLQKSLVIGLLAGVLTTAVAAVVGSAAGYFGGWADRILTWFVDLFLVLPSFLVIAILSPWFRGRTWLLFAVLIAAFGWMITARIVRSWTLALKDREFILAARYLGVPAPRIIARHILPNMASLLIVDATINVGASILSEVGLSFFGFGIQPPDVSLGTLIDAAQNDVTGFQWLFFFPALMLVLLVLSVNLVGDGLRDALDPNAAGAKAR